MMEKFIGKKGKWINKGTDRLISHMWLILSYTIQLVMSDVCTKFQNPRHSNS